MKKDRGPDVFVFFIPHPSSFRRGSWAMIPKDSDGALGLPSGLLPSPLGRLSPEEIDQLWDIFVAIARTWGHPDADPMPLRSQWLEFVELRVGQAPSYLAEYQNAIAVLAGWKTDQ